jgi:hypothetical protein
MNTRPRLTHQRLAVALLALALLWAQMAGLMHRLAHAVPSPGQPVVAALGLVHQHDHDHAHCDHAPGHAQLAPPAHPEPWGHAPGSEACAALDHAALADDLPSVLLAGLLAAPAAAAQPLQGVAQQRPAPHASYQATGPPHLLT